MVLNAKEIEWSQRVSKGKLTRLYMTYVSGLVDDELLEDVGITLYLRCIDIITLNEANHGFVKCPGCIKNKQETIIKRNFSVTDLSAGFEELLACPICGWNSTWALYAKSFKRKQLNSGGALDAFQAYVKAYPFASTSDEKMTLLDRLIHEFHYSLKSKPGLPTRTVGPNLIDCNMTEAMVFLNELTYGADNDFICSENHKKWLENADKWRKYCDSFRE